MMEGNEMMSVELTDARVKDTCKMGQGEACCRFLTIGDDGWSCAKLTLLAGHMNPRVAMNTMTARGDNCDGVAS